MRKEISILLPTYNEGSSFQLIQECLERVVKENPEYEWHFLFVNDGSTDNSLQQMIKLRKNDKRYNYIDLSRNYGKEIAMMAGFDYVQGDAVIIMDSDMQHPTDVIPEMLSWWEKGYDDVYAQRRTSEEKWAKRITSKIYYSVLQSITNVPIQKNTGDFRLLDRSCIEAIKLFRETERNTKGIYSWIGFRKKGIWYNQLPREYGETKWTFISLLNLALDGVMSYTVAPLRLSMILGFIVSVFAFTYLVYIVLKTIIYTEPVGGFPTIMVTILFLGGVQLLSLGIIGEYLGKVFNETKRRPGYLINSVNGEKTLSN